MFSSAVNSRWQSARLLYSLFRSGADAVTVASAPSRGHPESVCSRLISTVGTIELLILLFLFVPNTTEAYPE